MSWHFIRQFDAAHAYIETESDTPMRSVNSFAIFNKTLMFFPRKATRQTVDAWLVSHATSAGNDVVSSTSPTHANGQTSSSRGGSGATTPVR